MERAIVGRRIAGGAAAALALAAVSAGVRAEDPPAKREPPQVDQKQVDAAIAKGAEWLRARLKFGLPMLNEAREGLHAGQTYNEIVLYTLLHAGVDRNDPDLIKLIQEIRKDSPIHTYTGAIRGMALSKYDAVALRQDLVQVVQFLVNNQGKCGMWGYSHRIPVVPVPPIKFVPTLSVPHAPPPPPRYVRTGPGDDADPEFTPATPVAARSATQAMPKAEGLGVPTQAKKGPAKTVIPRGAFGAPHDNSNSQYALLGLSACMAAGVFPAPDCLALAEKWWTETQQADGGWNYEGSGRKPSTGSMTAGGVSSLSVCLQGDGKNRDPLKDERVKKGIAWLAQNLSFGANPQSNHTKYYWDIYYWIYAVERAGSLSGAEFFGDHPWYYEGASHLLGVQNMDGTWGAGVNDGAKILDTCWAILFLRRATKQIKKKMNEYTFTPDSQPQETRVVEPKEKKE
jgi:hypothetical protein